jgi:hypothetical protein
MFLKTPPELLGDWLAAQDKATRVALVIDSDRFLADTKVLDKSTFVDHGGRSWQLVVFRGDDLAFRLRFRDSAKMGDIVIVLSRGGEETEPIDVSHVADILAKNEAGEPLDLSATAFFRRVLPKISFPSSELRRFKTELLGLLEHAQEAAEKLTQRWGKPDSWGRGQVAAMVLLAHCPELTLADVWPDEGGAADFLAHVVRLLVGLPQLRRHQQVVQQVIHEAARKQVQDVLFWADAEPEHLAAYLVLREFAGQAALQNPATQLVGLQLFPPELPLAQMESIAPKVILALKRQPATWAAVNQWADLFLTPKRAARVLELTPSAADGYPDPAALLKQGSSAVLRQQLVAALRAFFKQLGKDALAWVPPLDGHGLLQAEEPLSECAQQCRAALNLLLRLRRIEQRLLLIVPAFSHADSLLDWYTTEGQHQLELDLSHAHHDLEACGDDELLEKGQHYLFGGPDELRPVPGSLKERLLARLRQLDEQLVAFVKASPEQFGKGPRSVRGFLRQKIGVANMAAGTTMGRVWVLIFDGMRFDSWEAVVKPLMAEFFEIQDAALFCVLPSFTTYARAGLLAGALPTEWKGFNNAYTGNEQQLFAVNMGLTQQEAKSKLRFVTDADTTKARTKLTFTEKDAAPLNVLIYQVSDDACHAFGGDLASFNNKIRAELVGSKSDGVRGILDDLLKRIGPDDDVVLSSDHGFVELLPGDAVEVAESEAVKVGKTLEATVHWRYAQWFGPVGMPDAVAVSVGDHDVWIASGRRWFRRKGGKDSARYTHGGLSLAEVVIPGVVLRRVTDKEARAELVALPIVILADEDTFVDLPVSIRNSGNCELECELRVSNNLGEELLAKRSRLAPATTVTETARLFATYNETSDREPDPHNTVTAVTVRLRHTDLHGTWREALDGLVTIPVKVKPKPVKLETEALKGFDDI